MAEEEEEAMMVRLRTLDGQSLLVAISSSKSVGDLRKLLLERKWPVLESSSDPARCFYLVFKGTKLSSSTRVSSLSLQNDEFIACIPYSPKEIRPEQLSETTRSAASILPVAGASDIVTESSSLDSGSGPSCSAAAVSNASARKKRRVETDPSSPPALQRLEKVFSALNAIYGFLQKNRVEFTWKNVSSALEHLADAVTRRTVDVTLTDIRNLATICPGVVALKRTPGLPDETGLYIELMHSRDQGGNSSEKIVKQLAARRKRSFDDAINGVVSYIKLKDPTPEITLDALLAASKELTSRPKKDAVTFARPVPRSRRKVSFRKRLSRCKDRTVLLASELVQHLREQLGSSGQLVHCEVLSTREAVFGQLNYELSDGTKQALDQIGVSRLYKHQAEAVNAAISMRSVVVSTSTASGKSLCYNIPVLEELSTNRNSCALYLFPTKALAQDQLRALRLLTKLSLESIGMGIYDGDTPEAERHVLRDEARLIVSNPDMLHCSVLPFHKQFERFLSHLRYVVVDEAHAYRGAFGSHTALIIRRLRRLCSHLYGTSPAFVVCSATIANPKEHAMELTGLEEIISVEEDGSPCGEKMFLLWNPPLLNCESGGKESRRSSPILEVSLLFAELVQHGLRCIAFCKTRKLSELVFRHTQETLKDTGPTLVDRIRVYRAGYTAEDRRRIEVDLFEGRLCGVAATSALELGIDVGSLDATLHLGFPGSVASLWQQAGRAGRREKPSISIYVAYEGPLDQHFMKDPKKLFARPIESAQVDPRNRQILAQHLSCAAFEHPLHLIHDNAYFGATMKLVINELEREGNIARHPSCSQIDSWNYIGPMKSPSFAFSIRAIDPDKYTIINERTNKVIEEVEANKAFFEVYEGAVYMNQGNKYLVKTLDLTERRAVCCPADVKYYTKTRDFTDVHIVGSELVYPRVPAGLRYPKTSAQTNKCEVTTRWIGFRRIWEGTNESFDSVDLSLPDVSYESQATWIRVPQAVRASVEASSLDLRAGLHAACHALLNVMPLYIMCNLSDLGTECAHPQDKRYYPVRLLVFDRCPGGIGISAQTQLFFGQLLQAALEQVKSCECSVNTGCPNCVQYFSCSEYNEVLDKAAASLILQGVIEAERLLQAT